MKLKETFSSFVSSQSRVDITSPYTPHQTYVKLAERTKTDDR